MKLCKRILPVILCLLLFPVAASATGEIDVTAETSLTITAVYGQTPIEGMEFSAYRVATVDEVGELTVTEAFADYKEALDIRGKNDAAWQQLASELERAIVMDPAILPEATAKADSSGKAAFDELSMGLYLVMSEGKELEGYVYTTSSFFVMLPTQNPQNNTWTYDVAVNAKPVQNPVRANYKVIKIWKDDCHKTQRPASITVKLLRDGTEYESVKLPHNGAWSYEWKDLDVNHKWTVTEVQQTGYAKPEIKQEGNTFTITNTCNKTSYSFQLKLPQTGQLWWPVPVLLMAGMLFVIVGLFRRRRDNNGA